MAPKKRTASRSAPYDPALLENWTLARLKAACRDRGISFPSSIRRFALVKLLRENGFNGERQSAVTVETRSDSRHSGQGARSHNSEDDVSQDGGPHQHNNIAALLSALSNSVSILNRKVDHIEQKLQAPAVTNNQDILTNASRAEITIPSRELASESVSTCNTQEFTLASAYGVFNSSGRTPSAAAGSAEQLSMPTTAKRTTFGYAAHTLPIVETVSQQLRHNIITDDKVQSVSATCRSASNTVSPNARTHDGISMDFTPWWENSLSKSTLATYKSALSCFLTFLTLQRIVAPWLPGTLPVVNEDILMTFVTFCQVSLHFRFETIKLYLAGIRFHYIKQGLGDPLYKLQRLPYILRAIKKSQDNTLSAQKRLPITFPILQNLGNALDGGIFTPFIDMMLLCAFKTAFYGFLRCGEFTCKSLTDRFVKISDVVDPDMQKFSLLLRNSKTDPFGYGVNISIFENKTLYPVNTMYSYLIKRRQQGAALDAPLFLENEVSYRPLTRSTFLFYLKEALNRLGYNDKSFSGHSFRIGACTSGAAAGVEGHVLQVLGRWKSDCFSRYIHTHPSTIKQAQNKLNISKW